MDFTRVTCNDCLLQVQGVSIKQPLKQPFQADKRTGRQVHRQDRRTGRQQEKDHRQSNGGQQAGSRKSRSGTIRMTLHGIQARTAS